MTYKLQDVKPLGEIIEEVQAKLLNSKPVEVQNAFIRFWNAGQESEWIYYSKEQALESIEEMKKEFLADWKGYQQETFAGSVARETGLELLGEPAKISGARW